MTFFRKNNGKHGLSYAQHTATGYECPAIIINEGDCCKDITFYAKQITSLKGKAFTVIGFYSDEEFNMELLYSQIKLALYDYGLGEVLDIDTQSKYSMTFSRYNTKVPNTLEFRICAGDDGVLIAFYALKNFIHQDAREFVQEQETQVHDVLYKSLFENLGEELSRSPGGWATAEHRCREIAQVLRNGIRLQQAN
jgi:hypothetical protein